MKPATPILTVLLSTDPTEIAAARGRGGNLVVLHPNDIRDGGLGHAWTPAPALAPLNCAVCGGPFVPMPLIGEIKNCGVLVSKAGAALCLHLGCYEPLVKKRKTKI